MSTEKPEYPTRWITYQFALPPFYPLGIYEISFVDEETIKIRPKDAE